MASEEEHDEPTPPRHSSMVSTSVPGGSTPIPDPTALTTDAVDRAVRQWRRDLSDTRQIIETRLNAIDRATSLRIEQIAEMPARASAEVQHAKDLVAARVEGLERSLLIRIDNIETRIAARDAVVDARFSERDQRVALAAEESRVSLKAALDAAKEAVAEQNKANDRAITKSDAATLKQIDALAALMSSATKSLEEKIADAARRLDRGEGTLGGKDAKSGENRDVLMGVFVFVSLLLAGGGLIVSIVHR